MNETKLAVKWYNDGDYLGRVIESTIMSFETKPKGMGNKEWASYLNLHQTCIGKPIEMAPVDTGFITGFVPGYNGQCFSINDTITLK